MYLPSDVVIQCSHGGRLAPDSRHFFSRGKQKFLTRESVLSGTIKGCKHCQKVEELISGCESEEPEALLYRNLDFLTDSSPAGRAVLVYEPPQPNTLRSHSILYTSLVWLCVALAATLTTIYYYEGQLSAYQAGARAECIKQMDALAGDLTRK